LNPNYATISKISQLWVRVRTLWHLTYTLLMLTISSTQNAISFLRSHIRVIIVEMNHRARSSFVPNHMLQTRQNKKIIAGFTHAAEYVQSWIRWGRAPRSSWVLACPNSFLDYQTSVRIMNSVKFQAGGFSADECGELCNALKNEG